MDLIDRQTAIEKVRQLNAVVSPISDDVLLVDKAEAMTELMVMPSVQPEIVYCRDCKHWLHEHLCIELSKYGTIETLPNEFCSRAERRTDE